VSELKPDDFRTADIYNKYVAANIDTIFKPIDTDSKLQTKSEFIKLDNGKRRLSLIEPQFMQTLGDVITFGAIKYAPNNWKLCEDTSRYKDALLRHIYAYLSGEQRDQETGIEHLAHAACNLMFLQYFDNKEQQ
jgi:hypothetical protein